MTLKDFLAEWHNDSTTLEIKTSGSTGEPKPIKVEKKRMLASARITCDFLGLKKDDTALLCLPLDYIAGKMIVVRAIERGLQLTATEPCGNPMRDVPEGGFDLVAMVPMQVYNTLQVEAERERLMQVRHLLIGGGAVDASLEKALRDFPNAVWSTYGMTETLSHIALRRLNGPEASEWYMPFDTVGISQNADGCLVINAPEICDGEIVTNDIVEMDSSGRRFKVIGRLDNVICCGGVKIQIEEVEKRLKDRLGVPFVITKRKDGKFGEVVVMLYEKENDADPESLRRVVEDALPRYWQPKNYFAVERLHVTGSGKPARKEAERLAALFGFDFCKDTAAY